MGALTRTHQSLEHKTQSRRKPLRAKSRQNLRKSARTPPEARGLLSDTIKRGTLSKNQKNCLDLVNNETKIQPQANPPHPRPGWTARPTSNKYPGSTEAPHHKASDEVPILRLARGPTPQGLGRGIDSPTRPRPCATRPRTSTQLPTRSRSARHQLRHRRLDRLPRRDVTSN